MDFKKILLRPTWIEIDLDAVHQNVLEIKRVIGEKVNLIPVLKGNAYGCGLSEVVQVLCKEDIYGFGVGNVYEAIEIRKNSNLPILLFGNTLVNAIPEIQRHQITPSISDWDWAVCYSQHARTPVPIFIKIDIGLNRLGVPYAEAIEFIQKVAGLPNIKIEGIQAHIGGEREFIKRAFNEFVNVITQLERIGIEIPIKLAAQSRLIAQFPSTFLNAVDPGKMVYGITPFQLEENLVLRPAFVKLASKIIHIKKSLEISQERFDRIGVLPLGMADGLPSAYFREGEVLVQGKRAPIIIINAEHTRIDLSKIPEAQIGDEVILIGTQGGDSIDFYTVARKCHTTESELLRALSRCLPKIYWINGFHSKIHF